MCYTLETLSSFQRVPLEEYLYLKSTVSYFYGSIVAIPDIRLEQVSCLERNLISSRGIRAQVQDVGSQRSCTRKLYAWPWNLL